MSDRIQEIIKALREGKKRLSHIAWENALNPGSKELLELSEKCGEAADLLESIQRENDKRDSIKKMIGYDAYTATPDAMRELANKINAKNLGAGVDYSKNDDILCVAFAYGDQASYAIKAIEEKLQREQEPVPLTTDQLVKLDIAYFIFEDEDLKCLNGWRVRRYCPQTEGHEFVGKEGSYVDSRYYDDGNNGFIAFATEPKGEPHD